jgi:hypothetical protein
VVAGPTAWSRRGGNVACIREGSDQPLERCALRRLERDGVSAGGVSVEHSDGGRGIDATVGSDGHAAKS